MNSLDALNPNYQRSVMEPRSGLEQAVNIAKDVGSTIVSTPPANFQKYGPVGGGLATIYDALGPIRALATYSPEAESAPIDKIGRAASTISNWFKGGQPVIQFPTKVKEQILESGKFKNQMELTNARSAWERRLEVEKKLAGLSPRSVLRIEKTKRVPENVLSAVESLVAPFEKVLGKSFKDMTDQDLAWYGKTKAQLTESLLQRAFGQLGPKFVIARNTKNARNQPVYGHVWNKDLQGNIHSSYDNKARVFGDSYAEFSPKVKDESRYVLGDSFYPFVEKTFSADDLMGRTSRLEHALFQRNRELEGNLREPTVKRKTIDQLAAGLPPSHSAIPFLEMWVPNRLSTLNNVTGGEVMWAGGGTEAFNKNTLREIFKKKDPIDEYSSDMDLSYLMDTDGLYDDIGKAVDTKFGEADQLFKGPDGKMYTSVDYENTFGEIPF